MDSRWFKGIPEDQKDLRKKKVIAAKPAFELLLELLSELGEEGTPDYSSPSWAYQQADRNGANRKLKDIIKLITVKDQK